MRTEKYRSHCFPEGKQFSNAGARLRAREQKNSVSHWSPEGERIGRLRCSIIKREQPRPDSSGSGQAWLRAQAKGPPKLEQAMVLERWLLQSSSSFTTDFSI